MSYSRKFVQETCELELGHTSYQSLNADRKNLVNKTFTTASISKIRIAADADLGNFYFKALTSLFEAISSASNGRYSWATVKLYYSVYYLLQVEMLVRGSVLIRASGLYRMILKPGQTFYHNKNREFNSDHSGTILHFMQLFKTSDPLCSNNINSKDAYLWLLEQRERVNYKERSFNEPSYPDFWDGPFSLGLSSDKIESTLQTYINDTYLAYAFQDNHAVLSIPIQRLIHTIKTLSNYGYKNILPSDKKEFLKEILPFNILDQYVDY